MAKEQVNQLSASLLEAGFPVRDLIDMSFHVDKKIGFRVAWVLETAFLNEPSILVPHLSYFVLRFPEQSNPSARRHFAKMIALVSSTKAEAALRERLNHIELDALVESLFSWLIDEKVAVAVKVHCMQALANLSERYDWIREELIETLRHFSDRERKAFFSRSRQIEKLLSK